MQLLKRIDIRSLVWSGSACWSARQRGRRGVCASLSGVCGWFDRRGGRHVGGYCRTRRAGRQPSLGWVGGRFYRRSGRNKRCRRSSGCTGGRTGLSGKWCTCWRSSGCGCQRVCWGRAGKRSWGIAFNQEAPGFAEDRADKYLHFIFPGQPFGWIGRPIGVAQPSRSTIPRDGLVMDQLVDRGTTGQSTGIRPPSGRS